MSRIVKVVMTSALILSPLACSESAISSPGSNSDDVQAAGEDVLADDAEVAQTEVMETQDTSPTDDLSDALSDVGGTDTELDVDDSVGADALDVDAQTEPDARITHCPQPIISEWVATEEDAFAIEVYNPASLPKKLSKLSLRTLTGILNPEEGCLAAGETVVYCTPNAPVEWEGLCDSYDLGVDYALEPQDVHWLTGVGSPGKRCVVLQSTVKGTGAANFDGLYSSGACEYSSSLLKPKLSGAWTFGEPMTARTLRRQSDVSGKTSPNFNRVCHPSEWVAFPQGEAGGLGWHDGPVVQCNLTLSECD